MKTKTMSAYSIRTTRVMEPEFPYSGQKMSCTKDLLAFARSMVWADNEQFVSLYLDVQNQIIRIQITRGIVNQAIVYPREIIRQALLINATAIILIHNHPSGIPKPSSEDISVTRSVIDAGKGLGIRVHDHIIIGGGTGEHYSMLENGDISR